VSPTDVVAAYLDERLALIEAAAPGTAAARELSDLTDQAVSAMAETALSRLRTPWAVLALGGWGARRLLPGSDLDLLVVTDAPASELKPALEQVLYPLWDSGLKVGHQVRSRRDHVRALRDDLDSLTATLTGRHLAGDEALSARVLAESAAGARKRAKRLVPELALRERPGSPYLLEPDLKEGAGGQRDLDELAWLAAVLGGAPADSPAPLVGLGLLHPGEADRLWRAGDRVTAARWSVHRASARATSLLAVDLADDGVATDGLHAALADAHHLLLRVRARAAGCPLSYERADAGALAASELFSLVGRGVEALPELEDAAWAGRLDDAVPAFADLMTLRRPALGHLYTVGAHSLRCATLVGTVAERHGGRPERTLIAAALLHDLGKVQSGPGHPGRGATMLETIAPRLALTAEETADAARIVAEHLLLPETAATEDIHDEDVLLRCAARIGRPDLLASLYALTEADSLATGPGAWTPWHAALVGELADRLGPALSDEVEGAGMVERAEAVRASALALLVAAADAGSGPDAGHAAFVAEAHIRYLAAQRPQDVAAHARLVADVTAAGGRVPMSAVSPGPAERTWRVTVAAADHPGLFAAVAGALALSGLDILSAGAFAAPGDVALDTFVVRPDTLAEVDTGTWSAFGSISRPPRSSRRPLTGPRTTTSTATTRRRPAAGWRTAWRSRATTSKSRTGSGICTSAASCAPTPPLQRARPTPRGPTPRPAPRPGRRPTRPRQVSRPRLPPSRLRPAPSIACRSPPWPLSKPPTRPYARRAASALRW